VDEQYPIALMVSRVWNTHLFADYILPVNHEILENRGFLKSSNCLVKYTVSNILKSF